MQAIHVPVLESHKCFVQFSVNIPHVKLVLAVGESDSIHGHQTGLLPATAVLSHRAKVTSRPSRLANRRRPNLRTTKCKFVQSKSWSRGGWRWGLYGRRRGIILAWGEDKTITLAVTKILTGEGERSTIHGVHGELRT